MKTPLFFIAFLSSICITLAQVPNQGFESWTNMGTYENPDNWGTLNDYTASSAVYTATKGTPGNPGSFYLKLTSKTVSKAVINGMAVSGVLDTNTMLPVSGFPYSLRPASFTGQWQHMIYGSSQGSISLVLTKWNSVAGKRDTVASALKTLAGMAMSWGAFTVNLVYQSADYPDSCIIFLKASGSTPTQNDYLWIDNLAFAGNAAGISEEQTSTAVQVFPNPAQQTINFVTGLSPNQGDQLYITDLCGRLVINQPLRSNSCSVDVSAMAQGTYNYSILNSYGISIFSGKFLVSRP